MMNTDINSSVPILSSPRDARELLSSSSLSPTSSFSSSLSPIEITVTLAEERKRFDPPSPDTLSLLPYRIIALGNGLWLSAYWANIHGKIKVIGIFSSYNDCIYQTEMERQNSLSSILSESVRKVVYTNTILRLEDENTADQGTTHTQAKNVSPHRLRRLFNLAKGKKLSLPLSSTT